MAENIIGLLFVTSTSRGRYIFRYPSIFTAPDTRLNQPIYPSSTFTAKDSIVHDRPRGKLFFPDGSNRSDGGGGSRAGTSSQGGGGRKGKAKNWERESDGMSAVRDAAEGMNFGLAGAKAGARDEDGGESVRDRSDDQAGDGDETDSSLDADQNSELDYNPEGGARRGSTAKANATDKPTPQTSGEAAGSSKAAADKFMEAQYNEALSYPLDFLADMLTPPRQACNRRFEICIDELVFLGHPVAIGEDGTWSFPAEDGVDEDIGRGRARRARAAAEQLEPVQEQREGTTPPDADGEPQPPVPSHVDERGSEVDKVDGETKKEGRKGKEEEVPTLNMFHLVVVLDKPDPHPLAQTVDPLHMHNNHHHHHHHHYRLNHGEAAAYALADMFDEVYREIAFKWSAAAFALQVRENFIAKQAWEIGRFKDRCHAEGRPIKDSAAMAYQRYALNRSLNDLATDLVMLKKQPANPLYVHLPVTVTSRLADMHISMSLSPHTREMDDSWAYWGPRHDDDVSSDGSSDSDDSDAADRRGGGADMLRVEPWQTLLLVDEDAQSRAASIAEEVVGLGMTMGAEETGEGMPVMMASSTRRGSNHTAGGGTEEHEGVLMTALIEACDVTKPLADISHLLRYDLEGIVIPLARELVQNRKAILINVVNVRLRTVVMPAAISEHRLSIDEYSAIFARRFSSLPPLAAMMSQLSSRPCQFRDLLPVTSLADVAVRQRHLDALIWMLKRDLVVQVHTHVRVFARPEVKERAWRLLWERRRARWIKAEASRDKDKLADVEEEEGDGDMETPKAWDGANDKDPMEVATADTPAKGMMEQSFMDYDPDLEMDSDLGEDDANASLDQHGMTFSHETTSPRPEDIPHFEGSLIVRPSRAQKDEARWLRVIRDGSAPPGWTAKSPKVGEGEAAGQEGGKDEVWRSKFEMCVQWFEGVASLEEIVYRTGLHRRELERLLVLYKDDVITFVHP